MKRKWFHTSGSTCKNSICHSMMIAIWVAGLLFLQAYLFIADASAQKTIKIGILAPVTGAQAADGQEMVRGAEMAVDEINAKGGIGGYKFELAVGDTRAQSSEAVVSAFQRLSGDPALVAFVASYASTTNFEIEYMAEVKMPYVIGANAAQTQEIIERNPDKYPTVWSLAPSYDAYGIAPADRMEAMSKENVFKLNNKKVAIIASDNPWSLSMYKGLKINFPKLGWKISLDELVPFTEINDWRAILTKIRQDPPDVIIHTNYLAGNAVTLINQFREAPTASIVIDVYAPSIPEFRKLTKEKSTGVLADILMYPVENQTFQAWPKFKKKFKERYGVETGSQAAVTFECAMIYFDALEKVRDPYNRLAIGKALSQTEKDTMFGHVNFDPKTHLAIQGDEYLPIQFFQVWEDDFVCIFPPKYANGKFRMPPWMK